MQHVTREVSHAVHAKRKGQPRAEGEQATWPLRLRSLRLSGARTHCDTLPRAVPVGARASG